MKKKLIGIMVCTLLISTVLTAAGKVNVEQMSNGPDVTLFDDGDVPVWEVGYSWTYAGELNIEEDEKTLNVLLNETCFCVVDDSGGSYKVAFAGDINLEYVIDDPLIEVSADDVSGMLHLSQSNLGIEEIDLSMSGSVKVEGIPYTVPGDVDITITYQETRNLIEFPISVGKTWTIPSTTTSVDIIITIFGFIKKTFNLEDTSEEQTAECMSREEVTVGTHTYDAFNISYEDGSWTYYAPSVGNIVKVLPFDETVDFSLEMIATSYPGPDNPLKPETPAGPTSGTIGHSYEYLTKAVDPNDDQIMYIWDWNGDMIPDEWTGFYDSDINITTSHTWTKQGSYEIRAKARDTDGLESVWSDPLPVTMPRNRVVNRPFLKFLQNHPHMFPILQRLLQRLGLQ
ncbi:MAG: hypothetical protein KAW45_07590 [Thermoplasmatales archaeon]|nr:hypothetical protein [Thermoplasmatales archaeon]